MKSRGFTVIELMASFSIALVILIVLFNITLIMKDNLKEKDTITNLLIKKDNLSYKINNKLKEKKLSRIDICADSTYCYLFTYDDLTTDKLIYNTDDKIITFSNYTFEVTDDIEVTNINIKENYMEEPTSIYNGSFIINIPIKKDDKDYSINILKFINSDEVTIVI